MKKVLVCGAFDFVAKATGGQPVKTRELYYSLLEQQEYDVRYIELLYWKKHPFSLLLDFVNISRSADYIIMLPAHNGVYVVSFLLLLAKKLFKCKIFYDVIGGWLYEKVEKDSSLKKRLQQFNGIWVETSSMKFRLSKIGLSNVTVVNNFKHLRPLEESEVQSYYSAPFKLCTFSRVMEKKGIGDAINAVLSINKKAGKAIYKLDIYGPVDESYTTEFEQLQKQFGDDIRYMGVALPEDSVKIIKDYFLLLFPTHFYTEGIPGTIIDAYCAGVPVVSSNWLNSNDVISNNNTGFLFEFCNYVDFEKTLLEISENSRIVSTMRINCIKKAYEYTPDIVIKQIKHLLTNS